MACVVIGVVGYLAALFKRKQKARILKAYYQSKKKLYTWWWGNNPFF